jgi:hypothetical protein
MSVLDKLTEGIVNRDLQKEGAALLNKWEKTGLLEGLNSDHTKDAMARLLENQAKELLREASAMGSADVEGFASVAVLFQAHPSRDTMLMIPSMVVELLLRVLQMAFRLLESSPKQVLML